ncbi:MAG: 50S ribosomal protein L11 [Candidatus Nealsonbacteria bacterium]|nr:50S ribosomal protein L11 [Candidatus Nealsonbacteria bacterium]
MAKEVKSVVKLQIPAGEATPAPPVGPILAQHGINIAEFCEKFNNATREQKGFKLPVSIKIYKNKSYDFKIKRPLVSDLLKKAAGIEKGSGEPNKTKVGEVTEDQLKKIAEQKIDDLNTSDIEKAAKTIAATAKNMGIEVPKKYQDEE